MGTDMGFEVIFYLFAIPALLWELINFSNLTKTHNFMNRLKDDKVKLSNKSSLEQTVVTCMIFYLFWLLVGLFSSQYVLFLLLLAISFIPKKFKFIRFVDSFISFATILFIILNRYHFGIDIHAIVSELVTQYVINAPIFK
jgi:hypothetical protein